MQKVDEDSDSDDAEAYENTAVIFQHFKSIKAIIRKSDKGKNIVLNYEKKKNCSQKIEQ